MVRLSFFNCGIGVDGARALADLLRGDGHPALKSLELGCDQNIGDEGAVALAGGLCEAPRTMLKTLNLGVRMGDVGMAALASVIEHGRMGQLRYINYGMTDKGLVALARAIDAWGLPKLQEVEICMGGGEYTALGFGALALAFVRGCPKMNHISLVCPDPGLDKTALKTMIRGMLLAAGRTAEVYV